MLRAIGMTQRQVRRMIRHESVITALIGAALGVVLGLVLGGLLAARVDIISFVVPWLQLDRLLRGGDPRRDRRGDPPGAARGAAERAGGASVRVIGAVDPPPVHGRRRQRGADEAAELGRGDQLVQRAGRPGRARARPRSRSRRSPSGRRRGASRRRSRRRTRCSRAPGAARVVAEAREDAGGEAGEHEVLGRPVLGDVEVGAGPRTSRGRPVDGDRVLGALGPRRHGRNRTGADGSGPVARPRVLDRCTMRADGRSVATPERRPGRARARARRRLLRDQPGPRLGRRGRPLREPAQRLLAAAPRRRLHAAPATRPRSSSTCSRSAIGVTNAAYRTTPGSGDLRARRLRRLARAARAARRRARGRARSGSSARRPTAARSASAPEHGLQERRLGDTLLFVLPSTSPANAAVPYAERLRWFRALRELRRVSAAARDAVRAVVLDPERPRAARRASSSRTRPVGAARRRRRPGRERRAGAAPRAAPRRSASTTSSWARCSGRASTSSSRSTASHRRPARARLPRPHAPRSSRRRASTARSSRPSTSSSCAGGRRTSSRATVARRLAPSRPRRGRVAAASRSSGS